ncbi:MAG: helix-turn-helix domain-containing protein [Thermodesulfobacteriota bacterium]
MNSQNKIIYKNKEYHCPVEVVIDLISGKWKSEAMWLVRDQPKRFGEIKRALTGISSKVLTEQLRELEESGLIIRDSYPEIPPRVEYSLSDQGRSLWPILEQMYDWGLKYLDSNSND